MSFVKRAGIVVAALSAANVASFGECPICPRAHHHVGIRYTSVRERFSPREQRTRSPACGFIASRKARTEAASSRDSARCWRYWCVEARVQ